MRNAKLAIAKSGTVTLELAWHQVPTVVLYALSPFDRFLATWWFRLDLPHYCMVNILVMAPLFPESIKEGAPPDKVVASLEELLGVRGDEVKKGCEEVWNLLRPPRLSSSYPTCCKKSPANLIPMRLIKFKHRFVAAFMLMVLKMIFKTCRVRLKGIEHFEKCMAEGSSILSFWHDSMAVVPPIFKKYCLKTKFVACISNSRDGDWLHAVVTRFPQADSIRIGHRARARGLLEMIREVEKETVHSLLHPMAQKDLQKSLKKEFLRLLAKRALPFCQYHGKAPSHSDSAHLGPL